MTNPFFVKFVKIWRNIPFLLASKIDWIIKIKVKIFLGIMKSLKSKMVYYVMMNFCMYLMALVNSKLTWCSNCRPLWIQQDHGTSFFRLLVAIALELCEGICGVMWCLCTSKKSLSSLTWTPLVVTNPYMAMVLNLHELYHESYTFLNHTIPFL